MGPRAMFGQFMIDIAKKNEKNLNLFFPGNLNLKYSKFRCIVFYS